MMTQFDILPLIDIGGTLDVDIHLEVKNKKVKFLISFLYVIFYFVYYYSQLLFCTRYND